MKKIGVGTRLGLGFGLVILMMMVLIAIALTRLEIIGGISKKIIEADWVKADAANTINVMTRENARQTMQLFIAQDKAQQAKIYEHIDANKKIISDAIATLDRLIYLQEGKEMLARITAARAAYVASFTSVGKLLKEEKQAEAQQLFNAETLPRLTALQEQINAMAALQRKIVAESSSDIKAGIDNAFSLILLLGGTAGAIGVVAAFLITRRLLAQLGGEPDDAVDIAGRIAGGDLAVPIRLKNGDKASLLAALKKMRDSLAEIVAEVRTGTDTIVTASGQIAVGNQDLSSRTEEQASSLEETASSMEQLTATVKQNADNAHQANRMAASASEVAMRGGTVVSQVVDTMSSINASSKKIVDIISVIDGIAFQTNILALNAAVEAARAGEQGRGFAVVATEVRTLAQRSASAAKEIKVLIGDSVEKVDTGARLVDQAGSTMNEILASIKRVTDIMGDITAASTEQTAGIEQINVAVSQMDQVTQQNAALVEEAAAAAQSMQDQAHGLSKAVSIFKLDGMGHRGHATTLSAEPAPAPERKLALASAGGHDDWEEF
ncbi:methyl-accepting chemotaxis protein [Janthinobacterium sp. 17J80-10]|uniref:methyl-accepting chemotaxis protein n=1 Tax=Janthinobacterium sp. 17J80-10 TaxID=2497863 RepID=UPI00267EC701